jgi:RecG-like helicase
MKKYIILLLAISMPSANYAFIYHIHIMRKWHPELSAYQYAIGCGDWHDKIDKSTKEQRVYLEQLLSMCDPQDTKIVVEDLSSDHNGQQALCNEFNIDTSGGILGKLAQVAQAKDVPVENIEFRHCRVSSIGPLLRNAQSDPSLYPTTNTLHIADLTKEINQALNDIKQYANPQFAKWAEQAHEAVEKHIKKLHLDKHEQDTVARYIIAHAEPKDRFALFNKLLTFDSALLDLKLAHTIINTNDTSTIIAVAGDTHITRAFALLKKLGYKTVYETDTAFINEHNLSRCLGTNIIDGSFCKRPEPVPLNVIEQYIDMP